MDALPDGWVTWHDEPAGVSVFVFRPDVFDANRFPAACLPTLTIRPARSRGPRGRPTSGVNACAWIVRLTLEPDLPLERETVNHRADAVTRAATWMDAFAAGQLPLAPNDDPHELYLETLKQLIDADDQSP